MNAFADLDRKKKLVQALRKWYRALEGLGPEGKPAALIELLAQELGRGSFTIENWIHGRSKPPSTVLDALEAALRKRGVEL